MNLDGDARPAGGAFTALPPPPGHNAPKSLEPIRGMTEAVPCKKLMPAFCYGREAVLPTLLVVLCVVFRVVPHPPNFAPVGATAVFAGRTLEALDGDPPRRRDHVRVRRDPGARVRLSGRELRDAVRVRRLLRAGAARPVAALEERGAIGAAVGGSVAFFVLSNFGGGASGAMYPHAGAGLGAGDVAAIPFFGGTLLGDIVWTLVLSTAYRPIAARLESRPLWVPVPTRELAVV